MRGGLNIEAISEAGGLGGTAPQMLCIQSIIRPNHA